MACQVRGYGPLFQKALRKKALLPYLINFCRQNKVVFRKAPNGMRRELDTQEGVGDMEIRVMIFFLSDIGDFLNEIHRFLEVLELEFAPDALPVLAHLP